MSKLMLRFTIRLQRNDLPINYQNHGLLFHRWLPDGEKDAISLNVKDPKVKLKVWFERFGHVDGNTIRYNRNKKNVDPKIMVTQAILESGHLFGLIEIQGISNKELLCLKKSKIGNADYIKLGKRAVNLIYPSVHNFLEILRTNFGQYWITNLKKWDSRTKSLGSYCNVTLNLKWSPDNGKTWEKFQPNKDIHMIKLSLTKDFTGYLTEQDWKEIEDVAKEYSPSLTNQILSRAYEFLDNGNLKFAVIEGVCALELAISEYMKKSLTDSSLLDGLNSFWQLSLRTQMISAAALSHKLNFDDLGKAVNAIEIRNKVVHEGFEPRSNVKNQILGLLNVAASFASGPNFRFLTGNPGNLIQSVTDWTK